MIAKQSDINLFIYLFLKNYLNLVRWGSFSYIYIYIKACGVWTGVWVLTDENALVSCQKIHLTDVVFSIFCSILFWSVLSCSYSALLFNIPFAVWLDFKCVLLSHPFCTVLTLPYFWFKAPVIIQILDINLIRSTSYYWFHKFFYDFHFI